MKTLFKFAAPAVSALAIAFAAPAAAQDIDPAVWVVKDEDTTVYLFGTFHVLDGKDQWFNDEVATSFAKADELILEASDVADAALAQQLSMKYGMDTSGTTLTERLSPDYQAKLAERLKANGAPANALDQLKPFLASMTLTLIETMKLGMSGEKGPEAILMESAKDRGMRIDQLEGIEYQLKMFADLPMDDQVEMLEKTLDEEDLGGELKKMYATWANGDAAGLGAILDEGAKEDKLSHDLVFRIRNELWADWIEKRMAQPGTVFVAVGGGHLVGQDSVQVQLGKKGIYSRRVRP